MLDMALIVSTLLFLVVNSVAWRAKHPVRPILASAFLIGLVSTLNCIVVLPPVLLQAILICVAALIWGSTQARPRFFLMLSCVATVLAFGIPAYFAYRTTRHLQELFPYVSMDPRLPQTKRQRFSGTLPAATMDHLTATETLLEEKDRDGGSSYRKSALRRLHEETVQVFVTQAGFGIGRMIGVSETTLKWGLRKEPPLPQPGHPSASPWLPELLRKGPTEMKMPDDLLPLHRESVVDFVNVAGFGYIKDRQHVAGFQEHQVSQTPEQPSRHWKVQEMDLIGLVVHEKPVVYLSEHLPRMDELRSAPLRDLDDFETAGLDALQRGDDLFVRERIEELRMLGAIRAVRQCLACHEGERGELLGAFSYRMTKDEK